MSVFFWHWNSSRPTGLTCFWRTISLLKDDRLPSKRSRHVGGFWAQLWSGFYGDLPEHEDTKGTRSLSEAVHANSAFLRSCGGMGGAAFSVAAAVDTGTGFFSRHRRSIIANRVPSNFSPQGVKTLLKLRMTDVRQRHVWYIDIKSRFLGTSFFGALIILSYIASHAL